MANPVKQAVAGIPKSVGEAVVKPALNEVSDVINETAATIFNYSNQAPAKPTQADGQKKADDERKRQNILRYFEALKANAASYKQSQDFQKTQKNQEEIEEKQKVRQFDIQAKQKKDETVYRSQRKAEIKIKGG